MTNHAKPEPAESGKAALKGKHESRSQLSQAARLLLRFLLTHSTSIDQHSYGSCPHVRSSSTVRAAFRAMSCLLSPPRQYIKLRGFYEKSA